jgi:hypothetical protein
MASKTEVMVKVIANAMVILSKFFSIKEVPEKVLDKPPPKAEDRPAPLPE